MRDALFDLAAGLPMLMSIAAGGSYPVPGITLVRALHLGDLQAAIAGRWWPCCSRA